MSKLDGYKNGDRFSVIMNGTVRSAPDSEGDMLVRYDGTPSSDYIFAGGAADAAFQITRIEPSFKVTDKVYISRTYGKPMEIVSFLKDGRAVLEYQAGDTTAVTARDISCLTHA